MQVLVTAINLDFEDSNVDYRVKYDEQIEIENDCLGVWEVDSEEDVADAISDEIGWCVNWVDYEIQLKRRFYLMRYKDQKTTILSELFHILEKDQFAMYDLLDSIIESLTPDQLNEIEDVIVNPVRRKLMSMTPNNLLKQFMKLHLEKMPT